MDFGPLALECLGDGIADTARPANDENGLTRKIQVIAH
jgi:hypothetical protein